MRLRILAGEALCAVAESEAMRGNRRRAQQLLAEVAKIFEDVTRLRGAARWMAPAAAQEMLAIAGELRHRALNVETVLRLLA
ncbi:MAG TPA: hypothetical protein VL990_17705 [Acidobacteriaceae bacterium]|nr:hypothetical protein [Acidobacteriaceae bacterium]